MRPRALAATLVFAALGIVSRAHAWTYGDTLTTIMRPLPNLPALVQRGHAFTVWALAPSGAAGWTASLRLGALAIPLTPSGGGWQATKGRWELSFTVPACRCTRAGPRGRERVPPPLGGPRSRPAYI